MACFLSYSNQLCSCVFHISVTSFREILSNLQEISIFAQLDAACSLIGETGLAILTFTVIQGFVRIDASVHYKL